MLALIWSDSECFQRENCSISWDVPPPALNPCPPANSFSPSAGTVCLGGSGIYLPPPPTPLGRGLHYTRTERWQKGGWASLIRERCRGKWHFRGSKLFEWRRRAETEALEVKWRLILRRREKLFFAGKWKRVTNCWIPNGGLRCRHHLRLNVITLNVYNVTCATPESLSWRECNGIEPSEWLIKSSSKYGEKKISNFTTCTWVEQKNAKKIIWCASSTTFSYNAHLNRINTNFIPVL